MSAMLNRFSTDIAKGVATVAGAKPPRTLVKMRFSTEPKNHITLDIFSRMCLLFHKEGPN